jgi:hypothetical protein
MNPQHRLVGAPTSLIRLDEWQIFVGDKVAQAWNSSKLLTTQLRIFAKQRLGEN